jgi:eukaryotic-like serine/threonine-protein kinase
MKHRVIALATLAVFQSVLAMAQPVRMVPPDHPRQIVAFDRKGNVVRRVGEPAPTGSVALSPDGTRVAVVRGGAIHVLTVATGASIKLTAGPSDDQPVWSTDGSKLAFVATRNGAAGIYQIATNGSGKEALVSAAPVPPVAPGWAPDGRSMSYHGTDPKSDTGNDLWILRVADTKHTPILRTRANELGARISPDGRFIAYRSNASGRPELYVRSLDLAGSSTGQEWKLSTQGSVSMVRWRRDGKELYHLAPDGITAIAVSTAPEFKAGSTTVLFQPPPEFPVVAGQAADVSADGNVFVLAVPVTGSGSKN